MESLGRVMSRDRVRRHVFPLNRRTALSDDDSKHRAEAWLVRRPCVVEWLPVSRWRTDVATFVQNGMNSHLGVENLLDSTRNEQ